MAEAHRKVGLTRAPALARGLGGFELEYAYEQNGDLQKSNAFTVQAGYEMSKVTGGKP